MTKLYIKVYRLKKGIFDTTENIYNIYVKMNWVHLDSSKELNPCIKQELKGKVVFLKYSQAENMSYVWHMRYILSPKKQKYRK